jgi:hypothetical protein
MSRQLALRLDPPAENEPALKRAWSHTRLRMPYDKAIRVPAIAICLRNMAAAEIRRKIKARRYRRAASSQAPAVSDASKAIVQ